MNRRRVLLVTWQPWLQKVLTGYSARLSLLCGCGMFYASEVSIRVLLILRVVRRVKAVDIFCFYVSCGIDGDLTIAVSRCLIYALSIINYF